MTESLQALAIRINSLAKVEHDVHKAFCIALAEAHKRVPLELKISFSEWAHKKLRKPDGTHWAHKTILKYASRGRHPEQIDRNRALRRNSMRAANSTKSGATEIQFNRLLSAWNRASAAARIKFLQAVNKEATPRVDRIKPAGGVIPRSKIAVRLPSGTALARGVS